MENKIQLVQEPIIKHELKKAGQKITERLAKLDLENQVATLETLKFLKETRSELNKEFSDYEKDRKLIKTACLNPYSELEEIYKPEIAEKYKNADSVLKDKISSVEIKVKEDRESEIKVYFIELCQSEEIDFVTFDQIGIEIKISDSMKSYKERCNKFIQQVCSDIDLIKINEFEAEIMAEYKISLNASESIKNVIDRKERERQEKERIKQIENNRKSIKLKNIEMHYNDMTKTYTYNDEIYISKDAVEQFGKVDFENKFIELDEKIKADKKANIKEREEPKKEEPKQPIQKTIETSKEELEKKEILKAPKKEKKLEIVCAKFEVKGTLPELKKLGEYMKENNLNYKNI
jgi:hypothetical protein